MARATSLDVTGPGIDPNEKLTVNELCAELKVSRSTFYDWRQKRRGPRCIRLPNGDLRIRRCDLDAWLAARKPTWRLRVPRARGEAKRPLSYDVRIWKTRTVTGAKGRKYQVRWTVAGQVRYATFANKALAESHEAKVRTPPARARLSMSRPACRSRWSPTSPPMARPVRTRR